MANASDSDDITSTSTASSSFAYNAASTLAPSQRDLRIQAARRNVAEHQAAAVTAGTIVANEDDNDNDGSGNDALREQSTSSKGKRPDLARIVTESADLHPSLHKESAQTTSKNASDAIFAQLQVIQTLQDDITRQHAKLESLDEEALSPVYDGNTNKADGIHPNQPKNTTTSTSPKSPKERAGTTTADKVRPEKHKHGPHTTAKERSAAHAYDDLAAAFQERAKGVDAIMEKMSKLSQAVKEFHSLPPPVLFPDSRMLNSGDVVETPIAMTPRVYHRAP